MPFLDRMGWVFATSVALIVVVSIIVSRRKDSRGAVVISRSVFPTDPVFAILAFGIMAVTAALYVVFWPRGQKICLFGFLRVTYSFFVIFYCYVLLLYYIHNRMSCRPRLDNSPPWILALSSNSGRMTSKLTYGL